MASAPAITELGDRVKALFMLGTLGGGATGTHREDSDPELQAPMPLPGSPLMSAKEAAEAPRQEASLEGTLTATRLHPPLVPEVAFAPAVAFAPEVAFAPAAAAVGPAAAPLKGATDEELTV